MISKEGNEERNIQFKVGTEVNIEQQSSWSNIEENQFVETTDKQRLVQKYAPVLIYSDNEPYFPLQVEAFLNTCQLVRREKNVGLHNTEDVTLSGPPIKDIDYINSTANSQLVINEFRPYMDVGTKMKENNYYLQNLQKKWFEDHNYTIYSRIYKEGNQLTLTYYFFYLGNIADFKFISPKYTHDGDWELIRIFFEKCRDTWQPTHILFQQHEYYSYTPDIMIDWQDLKEGEHKIGNHIFTYVAEGNHSTHPPYPLAEDHQLPLSSLLSRKGWFVLISRSKIMNKKPEFATAKLLTPNTMKINKINDREIFGKYDIISLDSNPAPAWLMFSGYWGEGNSLYRSPHGPKGPKYMVGLERSWRFTLDKLQQKYDVNYWLNKGIDAMSSKDFEEANYYFHRVLDIDDKRDLEDQLAITYHYMANISIKFGRFHYAEYLLDKSRKLFKKSEDNQGVLSSYQILGMIYSIKGAWENALKYFEASYQMSEKVEDKFQLYLSQMYLGIYAFERNDIEEAQILIKEANKFFTFYGYLEAKSKCHLQLAIIALFLDKLTEAEDHIETAISISQELFQETHEAELKYYQSVITYSRGDYEKAKDYIEKGLQYFSEKKNPLGIAICKNGLAVVLMKLREFDQAFNQFETARKIYEKLEFGKGLSQLHFNMGIYHTMIGDWKKAREHFELALEKGQESNLALILSKTQVYLGLIALMDEEWEESIKYFEQAFHLFSENEFFWQPAQLAEAISRLLEYVFVDGKNQITLVFDIISKSIEPNMIMTLNTWWKVW